MTTTNLDLQRDLGRLEGRFTAVEDRLDKIDGALERIDAKLARIEESESKRKGAIGIGQWLIGVIGGAIVLLVQHFWK